MNDDAIEYAIDCIVMALMKRGMGREEIYNYLERENDRVYQEMVDGEFDNVGESK